MAGAASGILLAQNMRIQIASGLDAGVAISAVTKATEAVVTVADGTQFTAGDIVLACDIEGMTELDSQAARVKTVSTNDITLESLNSTSFATFVSSGTPVLRAVSSLLTVGKATALNAANATANRIPTTTLEDSEEQFVFGLKSNPEISLSVLIDPLGATTARVREVSDSNEQVPVVITFNDNSNDCGRLSNAGAKVRTSLDSIHGTPDVGLDHTSLTRKARMGAMVINQKGQITVEAVLILTLFVGMGIAANRILMRANLASSLVRNPWSLMAGMIEAGVWRTQDQAMQNHPNLDINRRLSIKGELEPGVSQ